MLSPLCKVLTWEFILKELMVMFFINGNNGNSWKFLITYKWKVCSWMMTNVWWIEIKESNGSCCRIVLWGWKDGERRLMEVTVNLQTRTTTDYVGLRRSTSVYVGLRRTLEDGPGSCWSGLDLPSQLGELQPSYWYHGEVVAALWPYSAGLHFCLSGIVFPHPEHCLKHSPQKLKLRRMNVWRTIECVCVWTIYYITVEYWL